jgi:hypothetical protein
MKFAKVIVVLVPLAMLLAPARAAAQQPVRGFDQLDTRLKPGDTVWVTDAQGREVKGRIATLAADGFTLNGGASRTFTEADVRLVVERRSDSVGNGALIGMAIGGGVIATGCFIAVADDDASDDDAGWCLFASVAYAGIGAGIGAGIDAMIPGKRLVVYRAPGSGGVSHARLSIAPVVTRRSKGLAVSFAF